MENILLELKDANIVDIQDDMQDYSVFAGTFSDDEHESLSDLTLSTDKGAQIKLLSSHVETYGSPFGFKNPMSIIKGILSLVASGEAKEMTMADFILWLNDNYVNGGLVIEVSGPKNDFNGVIPTGAYPGRAFLDSRYIDMSENTDKMDIHSLNYDFVEGTIFTNDYISNGVNSKGKAHRIALNEILSSVL